MAVEEAASGLALAQYWVGGYMATIHILIGFLQSHQK